MRVSMIVVAAAIASTAVCGEITITKAQGDVHVRHGVTEHWTAAVRGDVLRPNDSVRTGEDGSAVLEIGGDGSEPSRMISLPAEVIVDMSDIRTLTQEELMLKLSMEKVRSSSYEWKTDELRIPNVAVVHGEESTAGGQLNENDLMTGRLQLNGARVLFANGFFSTCILRAMGVFRHYPLLAGSFDNRLMVADALVRADLRGEALSEYGTIVRMPELTPGERALVRDRMDAIKK
ncbi:MAG: hypothetical protein KAJ12_10655 [Bacteroidetes bacterium]|nr:hypothetical protein [Bacteroidota bacterium]